MLAEAELESKGVTTLAVSAINEVRTRAGIGKLPETISADALRQEIRDERGRELCFEALRKYDLIRWGIYVETISKNLANAIEDARWSNKRQTEAVPKVLLEALRTNTSSCQSPIKNCL